MTPDIMSPDTMKSIIQPAMPEGTVVRFLEGVNGGWNIMVTSQNYAQLSIDANTLHQCSTVGAAAEMIEVTIKAALVLLRQQLLTVATAIGEAP